MFSSYADRRELQALVSADVADRSRAPELWFDYVSDLGDGWNSTYTVARLLAAEELGVRRRPQPHTLGPLRGQCAHDRPASIGGFGFPGSLLQLQSPVKN